VVEYLLDDTTWHVKISDLGISKRIMVTNVNSVIAGTWDYMAPELKLHNDAVRPAHLSTVESQQAADMWAIGRVTQDLLRHGPGLAPHVLHTQGALDFVDRVMRDDLLLRLPAGDAIRHD
jgi:serine/threonine protein kinase